MPALALQSPIPAPAAAHVPPPAVQRLLPSPTPAASSTPPLLNAWTLASPTPAPGVTAVPVREGEGKVARYEGDDEAVALPSVRGVRLQKRQTVVQVVVVTVVTLIAATPQAQPTAVTLTVPSPQQTLIADGGWPIINPGSAAACWSDYACNSVCPNFQQNGWYSGCIDAACTQCRCQIIQPSMCAGTVYTNATWYTNAAPQTVTVYQQGGPYYGGYNTPGVVTVWVAGAAGSFAGLRGLGSGAGWGIGVAMTAWWMTRWF